MKKRRLNTQRKLRNTAFLYLNKKQDKLSFKSK